MASSTRSTRCTTLGGLQACARGRLQQAAEDDVQAPPPRLVQPPIGGRVPIGFQRRGDRRDLAARKAAGARVPRRSSHRRTASQSAPDSSCRCAACPARRTAAPRIAAPPGRARASMRALAAAQSGKPMFTLKRARSHGVVGKRVSLLVADHLQGVLRLAQHADRRRVNSATSAGRHELRARQQRQHLEQRGVLQPPVAAAAHQLHGLHDEFDLANSARAELQVLIEFAPRHLARDQRLHVAQRLEHAEVEIAAIHERPHEFLVCAPRRPRRRRWAAP